VFGCNQLAIRAHWSARGVGSLIAQGTIIGRAPSSPEMAPQIPSWRRPVPRDAFIGGSSEVGHARLD
jgi:hypothetical protein